MLKRSAKRGANMKNYIDMINTQQNIISPKTFLSLSDKEKRNIKSCKEKTTQNKSIS